MSNVVVHQDRTEVDVNAPAPTVLKLNQTFDRDFRASVGTVRRSARGTLDVQLPPGSHHVLVKYRPPGLFVGLVATILGVLLLAASPIVRSRLRGKTS